MTAYTVRHRTTYTYESAVSYSRLVAHLVPRATSRQQTFVAHVTVEPTPMRRFERPDFFGNAVSWFIIDETHDSLNIVAESRVTIASIPAYAPDASLPWEDVRSSFEPPVDANTFDVVQYTFDTPLTEADQQAVAYARRSFAHGRRLFDCVLELNARINADFTFDKKATDTRTTVKEAFKLRAGVCQDLAHVGIACTRAMGLAARYVSGYLLTQPPAGRERLIGADASHAWFAVWIPPFGWVDFDPTNNMLPSNEHITVAWGREYGDVAPVYGIITGGSEHEVDVAVDVIPEPDAAVP
jgi:transglutaminase-like putative cysteine protease